MKPFHKFMLILMGCLTLGLWVAVFAYQKEKAPLPALEVRNVARQEILEAFRDPKTNVEVPVGIKEFFERAGTLLRNDKSKTDEYFDFDRFADELNRTGLLDRMQCSSKYPASYREFKNAALPGIPRWFEDISWNSTQFRSIKWLTPNRDAVLITRHTSILNDEEVLFRMRWWIVRRPDGGWRIYDSEDISMGVRITPFLALTLEAMAPAAGENDKLIKNAELLSRYVVKFREGKQALLAKNFIRAEELLKEDPPAFLPTKFRAIILVLRSLAKVGQAKGAEALVDIEQAQRFENDLPIIDYIKTFAYNQTEQYEQTIISAKKYMSLVGADELVFAALGHAYEQLHRIEDAREAYEKSLDEQPSSVEVISRLRHCLDADEKTKFVERVMKLHKPEEHFLQFVNESFGDMDFEAAEALITAYRKRFPLQVEGTYQYARLQSRLHRPAEAKPLFLKAISEASAADHDRYLDGYLLEMANQKAALEAYRSVAATDAIHAFRTLAEEFTDDRENSESAKQLDDVIAAHRKRQPDDVWLVYYTAEKLMQDNQFEEAANALDDANTSKLEEAEFARFRYLHALVLYKNGQGLMAYRKLGKESFAQLAGLYSSEDKADGLDELLQAHRQAEPSDFDLHFWQGKLHWLRKEYAATVISLRRFLEKEQADKNYLHYQVNDMLIRSLIRLKKFAEARKIFQKTPKNFEFSTLPAAVAAVSGSVIQTETLLDELTKQKFQPASFYDDPDLGPALRSQPFTKLREKYPPPKDDQPLKTT